MPRTNPTIAPLYGGHTNTTQTVEASDHPTIRDRSAKQLTFGPSEAVKQKPTIARLRDACDALHIYGTRRLVAYELLSYFSPGGTVFPGMTALAHCLPRREIPQRGRRNGRTLSPSKRRDENPARMVRQHVKELERIGLWRRVARSGRSNLFELHLPGQAVKGEKPQCQKIDPRSTDSAPPRSTDSAVSNHSEVTSTSTAAAAVPPTAVPQSDTEQQQQQRRIDGMIASCEMSARGLDQDFNSAEHRERIRTGDLTIERLQEFTDGLRIARDERGRYTVRTPAAELALSNENQKRSTTPDAQPTDDDNTPPDGYRGSRIRNCPQCHTLDRGHDDTCQHCDWNRAAWDARTEKERRVEHG